MKTDVNGCSTVKANCEQFEEYKSHATKQRCLQYDYRAPHGELFSTVVTSKDPDVILIELARTKRDEWLVKNGYQLF